MSEAADITLKQGEAKTIRFTVTSGNTEVDLSTATLSFAMKTNKRATTAVVTKVHGDFNIVQAAVGVVSFDISATETDLAPGDYVGELRAEFSGTDIDKSADIVIKIERAIT